MVNGCVVVIGKVVHGLLVVVQTFLQPQRVGQSRDLMSIVIIGAFPNSTNLLTQCIDISYTEQVQDLLTARPISQLDHHRKTNIGIDGGPQCVFATCGTQKLLRSGDEERSQGVNSFSGCAGNEFLLGFPFVKVSSPLVAILVIIQVRTLHLPGFRGDADGLCGNDHRHTGQIEKNHQGKNGCNGTDKISGFLLFLLSCGAHILFVYIA